MKEKIVDLNSYLLYQELGIDVSGFEGPLNEALEKDTRVVKTLYKHKALNDSEYVKAFHYKFDNRIAAYSIYESDNYHEDFLWVSKEGYESLTDYLLSTYFEFIKQCTISRIDTLEFQK